MTSKSSNEFFHRENRDGTFDSVCGECFATVASEKNEHDLKRAEEDHACDPWRLETLRRYKSQEKR